MLLAFFMKLKLFRDTGLFQYCILSAILQIEVLLGSYMEPTKGLFNEARL